MLYGISSIFKNSTEGVIQKMKRTIMVMCTLAITVLIVSAVSVVPNVKADDEQDAVSNIFENFNFGLFNRLKDRVIAEVGMDVYNDTYVRVQAVFYDHLELSEGQGYYLTEDETGYKFHEPLFLTTFYEILVDIAVVLILLMVALFGHTGPGYEIGALCAMLVLIIPCFMFGMTAGAVGTVSIVSSTVIGVLTGGNLEDFIYDYGIVGLLLFAVVLLPLIALISIVVYFPVSILISVELLVFCITEALRIANDITP